MGAGFFSFSFSSFFVSCMSKGLNNGCSICYAGHLHIHTCIHTACVHTSSRMIEFLWIYLNDWRFTTRAARPIRRNAESPFLYASAAQDQGRGGGRVIQNILSQFSLARLGRVYGCLFFSFSLHCASALSALLHPSQHPTELRYRDRWRLVMYLYFYILVVYCTTALYMQCHSLKDSPAAGWFSGYTTRGTCIYLVMYRYNRWTGNTGCPYNLKLLPWGRPGGPGNTSLLVSACASMTFLCLLW